MTIPNLLMLLNTPICHARPPIDIVRRSPIAIQDSGFSMSAELRSNFLRTQIESDLANGRVAELVTRFPPEPNGFLHIGHAKSITVNLVLPNNSGGVVTSASTTRIQKRRARNLLIRFKRMCAGSVSNGLVRCAMPHPTSISSMIGPFT